MKNILYCFVILGIMCIYGCASVPAKDVSVKEQKPSFVDISKSGIYHRVEKGQTLWRIAKLYNIDVEELAQANRINDATQIQIGQMLFIPGAKEPKPVFSLETSLSSTEDFIWPLKGKVISSFKEISNKMLNKGINIQAPFGSEVVAARSGTVVFISNKLHNFGKTIIIEHDDGFSTIYARNAQILVRLGDKVSQGQIISRVGSAGRDREPYLHFEIRKGHLAQNPRYFLP